MNAVTSLKLKGKLNKLINSITDLLVDSNKLSYRVNKNLIRFLISIQVRKILHPFYSVLTSGPEAKYMLCSLTVRLFNILVTDI